MSYCRWSTENFKCDLYCYADCNGGYTTHVAGSKIISELPEEPSLKLVVENKCDEYLRLHKVWQAAFDVAERAPIGLPHDGESFNDPDLQSFYERIEYLMGLGYYAPKWLLEDIAEEINQEATSSVSQSGVSNNLHEADSNPANPDSQVSAENRL